MSLNQKIVSLLKRKKLKIAVAESCTGGMLSNALTSVSGSSKVFTLGLVTYSNQAKTSILKVPKKIISRYGAVSIQCCSAMINNLSKISKTKICVSITGIAGPKGGSKQKPVGLVWFGFGISGQRTYSTSMVFSGDRRAVRLQAVDYALLEMIRLLT